MEYTIAKLWIMMEYTNMDNDGIYYYDLLYLLVGSMI